MADEELACPHEPPEQPWVAMAMLEEGVMVDVVAYV